MSGITPFSFGGHHVRITDQSGDAWFSLRDLLSAMGSSSTTSSAVKSITSGLGEGFVADIPLDTPGGTQNVIFVAEAAATYILSRSNTDSGRALNRFIHVNVLPAIRRTGTYAPQQATRQPAPSLTPMEAARIYCNTFAMARRAGMGGEACHNLACQTKYEASGWWWQFGEAPVGAILASPSKPLQIAG